MKTLFQKVEFAWLCYWLLINSFIANLIALYKYTLVVYIFGNIKVRAKARAKVRAEVKARAKAEVRAQKMTSERVKVPLPLVRAFKAFSTSSSLPMRKRLQQMRSLII